MLLSLLPVYYSLLPVYYSLLPLYYSLLPLYYSLLPVYYSSCYYIMLHNVADLKLSDVDSDLPRSFQLKYNSAIGLPNTISYSAIGV